MRLKFTMLYIALIVAVNSAFTQVPSIALPDGTVWPPVALIVGFVFVVRDFAQREVGHRVLLAMLAGGSSTAWSGGLYPLSETSDVPRLSDKPVPYQTVP